MPKYTDVIRDAIIANFEAGDQPTAAQFAAWILAIQEGIELHNHDGTGDGDGIAALGPLTSLTMADNAWIGIGAALERIIFAAAGDVYVMGAQFGVGIIPTSIFQVSTANVGATNVFAFENTDGTNLASHARIKLVTGGAGGGDPYMQFTNGVFNWVFGVDNSDADKFKIANWFEFGTNEYFIIDATGKVGINQGTPTGRLHVKVPDAAVIPVLVLEQLDASEEFTNYVCAATGAGNPVDTVTAVGANYARLRVSVNGVFKYIQLHNA